MPRSKNAVASKARRKKILKQAKGFYGKRKNVLTVAKNVVEKGMTYMYVGRKKKKREFRKLWITRINAKCREEGISYSRFIEGLTKAGVIVNRKMLSEIAINDEKAFQDLVNIAKEGKLGNIKSGALKDIEVTINKNNEEKTEEPKKETPKKEAQDDISKLALKELKELAKEKKIKGYSTMKKADLITALT